MKAVKKVSKYLISVTGLVALALMLQVSPVKAADEASNYGDLSGSAPNSAHVMLKRVQGTVLAVTSDGDCYNISVRNENGEMVTLRVCSQASSETQDKGGWGCPTCAACLPTCLKNLDMAIATGVKVRFYTLTDPDSGYVYIQGYQDDPDDSTTCHCFDIIG